MTTTAPNLDALIGAHYHALVAGRGSAGQAMAALRQALADPALRTQAEARLAAAQAVVTARGEAACRVTTQARDTLLEALA